MSDAEARGEDLAAESDATRAELLAAIEQANDELSDAVPAMNRYASHDDVRPSAIQAFDRLQDALDVLADVDPTRSKGDADE